MVFTEDKIYELLFYAYLDARANEQSTPSQIEFELDLEGNIRKLAREVYLRTWKPEPPDKFIVLEPTAREIFAPHFRDRIVSHFVFNILYPIFERVLIYDSYSCRKGKGTLFGIERMRKFYRCVTENYTKPAHCLSIDISGYFMSINRQRLYDEISKVLRKYRPMMERTVDMNLLDFLIQQIVFRNPLEGCQYLGDPALQKYVPDNKKLENSPEGTGIIIGDVDSQLFSNIYMNPLDQFCKREIKLRYYGRYVDDGKAFHQSKAYLEDCADKMNTFLKEDLLLELHPNKTKIVSLDEPIIFLGGVILPYRVYATNKTISRFEAKLDAYAAQYNEGQAIDCNECLSVINSYLGYLGHFNEWRTVEKLMRDWPLLNIFDINNSLTKIKLKK